MSPTRHILHGLALITVMTLLAWLLGDLMDRHWIDVYVRDRGVTGELLFVGVTTLLISIGISRQLVAFLAGYGFGFTGGCPAVHGGRHRRLHPDLLLHTACCCAISCHGISLRACAS